MVVCLCKGIVENTTNIENNQSYLLSELVHFPKSQKCFFNVDMQNSAKLPFNVTYLCESFYH